MDSQKAFCKLCYRPGKQGERSVFVLISNIKENMSAYRSVIDGKSSHAITKLCDIKIMNSQTTNDLSQIISRTASIENILNQIIHAHTSPRKDAFDFFWNVLLDCSVMPLGSKIKVAMVISQEFKFKLDKHSLHNVISYRNAFAHHDLGAHPVYVVGKTPDEDKVQNMLHIIKSSGVIEKKCRKEALEDFNKNYNAAKVSLVTLLKFVKKKAL